MASRPVPRDERAVDYAEPLLPQPGARVKLSTVTPRTGSINGVTSPDDLHIDPDYPDDIIVAPTKNQLGTINGVRFASATPLAVASPGSLVVCFIRKRMGGDM